MSVEGPVGASAAAQALRTSVHAGGKDLVGAKVKVWWSGDDAWFTGRVDNYSESGKKKGKNQDEIHRDAHHVKYEDGDHKWHALWHAGEKWEILELPAGSTCAPFAPQRGMCSTLGCILENMHTGLHLIPTNTEVRWPSPTVPWS